MSFVTEDFSEGCVHCSRRRILSHFEGALILARTDESRKDAQARGVTFGHPAKLRADQKKLVFDLIAGGESISAIARTFNVHPATISRCIKESQP